jgi:hypothetical protein
MKSFVEIELDAAESRRQIDELGRLLDSSAPLRERKEILPFFRARPQLSAWLGSSHPDIILPDRIAFEYDLFGDFACDLVVGDSRRNAYSFIEFEDAKPDSIFVKKPKKSTPEWSPRFDHGFSQIIDWFWKLDDLERTTEFASRFGGAIEYNALLIIGRGGSFGTREDRRWKWRQRSVVVDNKHINCITYDDLHEALDQRLARWETSPERPPDSIER